MADFTSIRKEECEELALPPAIELTSSRCYVLRSVLNEIKRHGLSSMREEVCGVLVGSLCWDDGPYLRIDGRIEGKYAGHQAGSVTFTSETWTYVNEVLERDFAGKRIVGWYHTHPGFGIFLSGMDAFIHDNFFDLCWQTAFVYDPHADEEGFFFKVDGELKRETVPVLEDEAPVAVEVRDAGDLAEEKGPSVARRLAPVGIGLVILLLLFTALFGILRTLSTDRQKEALEAQLVQARQEQAAFAQTEARLREAVEQNALRFRELQAKFDRLEKAAAAGEKSLEEVRADRDRLETERKRLEKERDQAATERQNALRFWRESDAKCLRMEKERDAARAERKRSEEERDQARRDWARACEERDTSHRALEEARKAADARDKVPEAEEAPSDDVGKEGRRSFWSRLVFWK